MSRVTKAELNGALERYVRALNNAGFENHSDVELHQGSVSYGRCWRLHRQGSSAIGTDMGHLGTSAREALETLRTMARVLEDAMYYKSSERL